MKRSPTHAFTCSTADAALRHCEIRPDALDALRHLYSVLRDRMSVLIESERWQHSLARNSMGGSATLPLS